MTPDELDKDAKQEKVQNFAELLKKQFTTNDLFNKYSDYDYSCSPNIPKEVTYNRRNIDGNTTPWEITPSPNPWEIQPSDKPFSPYEPYEQQRRWPYQPGMPRQKTAEEEEIERIMADRMEEVLRRFEEQQNAERAADLRKLDEIGRLFGGSKNLKKEEK